jgi:L-lactate dehydrogenase (cytochrome)
MPNDKILLEIHGIRYDLTGYDHPGGKDVLLQFSNTDATEAFDAIHSLEILKLLPPSAKISLVDGYKPTRNNVSIVEDLCKFTNLYDFENVAKEILTKSSTSYISSGGEDEITMRENEKAFKRILFKPRILRNVSSIDTSMVMQGYKTSIPIYISATAQVGKSHVSGEVGLSQASRVKNIIYMVPMLNTFGLDEIMGNSAPSRFWFQVYVNKDKNVVHRLISDVISKGITTFCLTVDRPQLGN